MIKKNYFLRMSRKDNDSVSQSSNPYRPIANLLEGFEGRERLRDWETKDRRDLVMEERQIMDVSSITLSLSSPFFSISRPFHPKH
jgi:hypothetical protein